MRHYQWNDPSWTERKFPGKELEYCDDTPHGMLVSCGFCKNEFILTQNIEECPFCSNDLVFPRADW